MTSSPVEEAQTPIDSNSNGNRNDCSLDQIIARITYGREEVPLSELKVCIERAVEQQLSVADSAALFAYFEEQEFEGGTVYEEFKGTINDCQVFDEWTGDHSKAQVYHQMRVILKLALRKLTWPKYISREDIEQVRQFLNKQTFHSFSSQMRLAVVGKQNNIPGIVLLFFDVYCKYHVEQLMSQKTKSGEFKGNEIEPYRFCKKSPFVRGLPSKSAKHDVLDALNSFGDQRFPLLKITRNTYLISDRIADYIEYTAMVQEMVHDLVNSTDTESVCPLQVLFFNSSTNITPR